MPFDADPVRAKEQLVVGSKELLNFGRIVIAKHLLRQYTRLIYMCREHGRDQGIVKYRPDYNRIVLVVTIY